MLLPWPKRARRASQRVRRLLRLARVDARRLPARDQRPARRWGMRTTSAARDASIDLDASAVADAEPQHALDDAIAAPRAPRAVRREPAELDRRSTVRMRVGLGPIPGLELARTQPRGAVRRLAIGLAAGFARRGWICGISTPRRVAGRRTAIGPPSVASRKRGLEIELGSARGTRARAVATEAAAALTPRRGRAMQRDPCQRTSSGEHSERRGARRKLDSREERRCVAPAVRDRPLAAGNEAVESLLADLGLRAGHRGACCSTAARARSTSCSTRRRSKRSAAQPSSSRRSRCS